jgi:hypothetical protein
MLDVYQRPDYWFRPRQIMMWRLATSLPYCRTVGRNTRLHVPTYTCLVSDRPTRQDPLGLIDNLCRNLHRDHHSVDSFLSLIKSILVLTSKSLLLAHDDKKLVNCFHPDFRTPSRCAASLGWTKGLMHCMVVHLTLCDTILHYCLSVHDHRVA